MAKSSKITIQNITGGWAKDITQDVVSRNTTPFGYTSGLNVHFSRPGFLGDISSTPNVDLVNIDGDVYNGKIYTGTNTSDGVAWFMTTLGTTYKRNVAGSFLLVDDIAAVTREVMGSWTHIDNLGDEKVYQSYFQNGGGWLVDQIDPITSVRTNLYTNVGATPDLPRKGITGPANKSYMTNGEYVSTYNPTTNTFSATALLLGTGWISTSIADNGNYVAIVGYRGNKSRLWIWDGSSSNPNYSYDIPDYRATAVKTDGEEIYVFCSGKNGTTKLRLFSGGNFKQEPLFEYPTSSIGQPPQHDGVDIFNNSLFWVNEDGKVFSYGTPNSLLFYKGFHNPFYINVPSGSGGGICKNLQEDVLFVGGDQNSLNKTTIFTTTLSNSTNTPASYGSIITKLYELDTTATIEKIKVYFSDWGDDYCGFDIELFKDYSLSDQLEHVAISKFDEIGYYYEINCSVPDIESFYLKLTLANCSIRKIVVFYTYEDKIA